MIPEYFVPADLLRMGLTNNQVRWIITKYGLTRHEHLPLYCVGECDVEEWLRSNLYSARLAREMIANICKAAEGARTPQFSVTLNRVSSVRNGFAATIFRGICYTFFEVVSYSEGRATLVTESVKKECQRLKKTVLLHGLQKVQN
ncbi:MAG: hypothetical protein ACP5H5_07665 [Pyrobaculum sp.]